MSARRIIFWTHLGAGLVAGAVVFVMCITGAAIAFEKEAVADAEKSASKFQPPANAPRLPLDELIARASEKRKGASAVTLSADPAMALTINFGRTNAVYVNPYTGELREPSANATRGFMRTMTDWHRWLGREGDGRAVGKAITGACNAAFLFLAISGVVLWVPRRLGWNAVRAILFFKGGLRGKARDWNWHNVIGFWSSTVLIVLTASGMVISYRWAGDLVYKLAGSPPPSGAGPGASASPPPEIPARPPGAKPLTQEALASAAQKEFPAWEQIIIRLSEGGGRGEGRREEGVKPQRRGPQAVAFSIRERGQWPLFVNTQVWLDPYTGSVLRKEGFADYNGGRKARMWLRFLHTGEAFGVLGKVVAAAASLGGAFLVWTGFSLAARRFFGRPDKPAVREAGASKVDALSVVN